MDRAETSPHASFSLLGSLPHTQTLVSYLLPLNTYAQAPWFLSAVLSMTVKKQMWEARKREDSHRCVHAKSRPALCSPVDCSLPGSSVHGISQAETLEWVPFPPPGDLHDPGIEPASLGSPALAHGFFTTSATWETSFSLYVISMHFRL